MRHMRAASKSGNSLFNGAVFRRTQGQSGCSVHCCPSLATVSRAGLHFEHPRRLDVDYEVGGTSVWVFARELLNKYEAVNHGQGFPDWQSPDFVKQAAYDAISADYNQYSPPFGHPQLLDALIKQYSPLFHRELQTNNIQPVSGACMGIAASCQAFLSDGDEVVTFEPYFDIYKPQIYHAGGTMKTVPLELDRSTMQWTFNPAKLEEQITDKTKILLLNTPHNPTGMVFSRSQLQSIVDILQRHPNVIVVSDEVYENLVFGESEHHRIATFDDGRMFDRTVTVNSASKKFSVTGWKIGWCIGPSELIRPINFATRAQTWCIPSPLQVAVANMFTLAKQPYQGYDSYWDGLSAIYDRKRADCETLIRNAGFNAIPTQGTFFAIAEISDTINKMIEQGLVDASKAKAGGDVVNNLDWQVSAWVARNCRVTCLPMSAFCTDEYPEPWRMMRFTFCVSDESFEVSKQRMAQLPDLVNLK